MRAPALLTLLILAGCGGGGSQPYQEWGWHKPGATPQELQAAAYECERDTRLAARTFGTGVVAENEARAFATRCMNAKGFSWQVVYALPVSSPGVEDPGYRARYDEWLKRYRECGYNSTCSGPPPNYQ